MSDPQHTVLLAVDARSMGDIHNRQPRLRIRRALSTIYAVECPYDPERLTDRARALLAAGWRGTVYSDDDLVSTPLRAARRSASVSESVRPLVDFFALTGAAADRVMRRATDIARAYGDDARVDVYDVRLGAAPADALDDATQYINAIAETRGLLACGDDPVDAGAAPWAWMLTGIETYQYIPVRAVHDR